MIQVKHNIDVVIADLETARGVLQKQLMPHVMQPGKYLEQLRADALQVLQAIAEPEERQYIDAIVNAVAGYAVATGMTFQIVLANSTRGGGSGGTGGGGGGEGEDGEPRDWNDISAFEADVASWVAEFKIKDSSDYYRGGHGSQHAAGEAIPDIAIARRIIAIIKHQPELFFSTNRPGHGANDPTGLFQTLLKNPAFGQSLGLTGLAEDRCLHLMVAVLRFWHEVIGVRLVGETMRFLNATLDKPVPA